MHTFNKSSFPEKSMDGTCGVLECISFYLSSNPAGFESSTVYYPHFRSQWFQSCDARRKLSQCLRGLVGPEHPTFGMNWRRCFVGVRTAETKGSFTMWTGSVLMRATHLYVAESTTSFSAWNIITLTWCSPAASFTSLHFSSLAWRPSLSTT